MVLVTNSLRKAKRVLYSNSLTVIGDKQVTKKLATLYVEVPIADKVGLIGGEPLTDFLCTLLKPYKTPGFEPLGHDFFIKFTTDRFLI